MTVLDFPSSPVNGQVFGNYTYDSVVGVWRASTQATPGLPAGTIVQWPTNTAPNNWVICDGSAISRTTYASLFATIGVTYGVGDGSTTFNVPNLKGKVPVGRDASDTNFDTLNSPSVYVGAKTHTLTTAQIPSHTHSGSTNTTGAHTHGGANYTHSNSGTTAGAWNRDSGGGWNQINASSGDHSHTFTTDGGTGGGGAHNNLQPYIVLNYIIKTSAGATLGDSELAGRVGNVEIANNATPLSPNYVINGALDYWQRSTSAAQAGNSSGFPSADRIRVVCAGASSPAITLARSTDVPAGIGAQYSGAMSWSSNISGGDIILHHGIENGKFLFAGKTVTISFYAKASTAIQSKFDFDQDYNETFFNLTTSWARYSYTVTLPSNYGTSRPGSAAQNDNVEMRFIRFTSISSASNTIYFTGLQVEEGVNATPFRRSAPSLQAELSACQRYFYRLNNGEPNGWVTSDTAVIWFFNQFPVPMRATPTISVSSSGLNYYIPYWGESGTGTAYASDASKTFGAVVLAPISPVRSTGKPAMLYGNGSSQWFSFSAEI